MTCSHDNRFRGVFGTKNGCLACELESVQGRLNEVERYCRQHAHAGVNAGEHAALNKILRLIDAEPPIQQ